MRNPRNRPGRRAAGPPPGLAGHLATTDATGRQATARPDQSSDEHPT
ncbi:hypothetical protein [Amycolatopsis sp. 195334CR]|nr:hypothetical protein [Amycolatopsis sp. 195334CR]MBN6035988.1 hypothetical protein [Amycolatopsis sp. 195334CR]